MKKSQIPNPNIQTNHNYQNPNILIVWNLKFEYFLGFGVWDLGFRQ
jgi:hypothetical protein